MMTIKEKCPTAIYYRPHESWWPRFVAFWRRVEAERGAVARQTVLTDIIIRGLNAAESEQTKKKK